MVVVAAAAVVVVVRRSRMTPCHHCAPGTHHHGTRDGRGDTAFPHHSPGAPRSCCDLLSCGAPQQCRTHLLRSPQPPRPRARSPPQPLTCPVTARRDGVAAARCHPLLLLEEVPGVVGPLSNDGSSLLRGRGRLRPITPVVWGCRTPRTPQWVPVQQWAPLARERGPGPGMAAATILTSTSDSDFLSCCLSSSSCCSPWEETPRHPTAPGHPGVPSGKSTSLGAVPGPVPAMALTKMDCSFRRCRASSASMLCCFRLRWGHGRGAGHQLLPAPARQPLPSPALSRDKHPRAHPAVPSTCATIL